MNQQISTAKVYGGKITHSLSFVAKQKFLHKAMVMALTLQLEKLSRFFHVNIQEFCYEFSTKEIMKY